MNYSNNNKFNKFYELRLTRYNTLSDMIGTQIAGLI